MVSLAGDFHSNQLLSSTQYHYSFTSRLFQKNAADENSTVVSENLSESVIDFRLRELFVDRNKPLKPTNPNLISLICFKLSAISLLTIVTSLESCRGFLQCDNNAFDTVQFYKNVFETKELKLGSSIVLHGNRLGNRSSLKVTASLSSPRPQSIGGVAFLTIVVKSLNLLYDPISKSTPKSEEKKGVHGYVTKNLVYSSEEGINAMEFSCSNTLIVPFNPETVSISNAETNLLLQKARNWLQGPHVYYLYRKLGIG
ncbi:hypothetical protein NE237_021860 [Protea cynaroides]|uniref:Uncharacterized protein n=1 Tax=Protea cynaroides TaxID=273540 RepID=A0A9Q0H9X5_9MAGN|nr:hypothetical protein NE237_021860 [Protea cynaroides]